MFHLGHLGHAIQSAQRNVRAGYVRAPHVGHACQQRYRFHVEKNATQMISSDIVAAHGPVGHDRVVRGLDATAWHALAEAAGGAAVRIVATV
eukprot:COSAG04_NODE_5779_length_1495_cov_0.919771_1_plen_92_part_00